jgi:hypothetical protein
MDRQIRLNEIHNRMNERGDWYRQLQKAHFAKNLLAHLQASLSLARNPILIKE